MSLNELLFTLINSFAGQNQVLDYTMMFFTGAGIIIIAAIALFTKDKLLIIKSIAAGLLAYALSFLVKISYYTPRPFVENPAVHLLTMHDPDPSFPSTHTLIAVTLATVIYQHNKKLGIISFLIALIVGFSRVYVGVHYPSDVFWSSLIGITIGLATVKGVNYYNQSRKI